VLYWFSRGGGVDERRDGSWKEFGLELVRHALNTWNLLLGGATFAALLLQNWVGPERLGIFGSPLVPGLAFLVIAFFYASFRLYRDTVQIYESRFDRIFASRPRLLAGFNVHGQLEQVLEATVTPVPPLPEKAQYEAQVRDRLADRYERERAKFLERANPITQMGQMGERLYSEDGYEQSVDEYLDKFETYLEALVGYQAARQYTIPINVMIRNDGPVIAASVGFEIMIPTGLRFARSDEVDAYHDEDGDFRPEKPREPRVVSEPQIGINPFTYLNERFDNVDGSLPEPVDNRGPFIVQQGERARARYDIAQIAAGRTEDGLNPFYVVIKDPATRQFLNLEVALYADGLDQPIRSNLVLRITPVDVAAGESRRDQS
jgi:hypothetical protein